MRIMTHEMENPAGRLHEVFRDAISPLRRAARAPSDKLRGKA